MLPQWVWLTVCVLLSIGAVVTIILLQKSYSTALWNLSQSQSESFRSMTKTLSRAMTLLATKDPMAYQMVEAMHSSPTPFDETYDPLAPPREREVDPDGEASYRDLDSISADILDEFSGR